MEPDGNRNAPSPMLPCTIRPSNMQNQSLPNTEKTNFHLPTSKWSKIETDWNLHWPTSDEVGWSCLTHDLEPPSPKNANSMVQLKNTKRSTSNDIWTKFEKSFQMKERRSWNLDDNIKKIDFAGGKKADHSDNHSFPSSIFLVNNSSVIPRFKP